MVSNPASTLARSALSSASSLPGSGTWPSKRLQAKDSMNPNVFLGRWPRLPHVATNSFPSLSLRTGLLRSTNSSHENRRRRVARLRRHGGEIEAQVILLDPGEASCLALAISRGLVFVTDDLATRQLAQERDVRLTGTVGILLALARNGSLSLVEVSAILTEMIKQRYRSPVDRLDELV